MPGEKGKEAPWTPSWESRQGQCLLRCENASVAGALEGTLSRTAE